MGSEDPGQHPQTLSPAAAATRHQQQGQRQQEHPCEAGAGAGRAASAALAEGQRAADERHARRERRKALWAGRALKADCEDGDGALSANGWEHSRFHSAEEKGKFLRLMGGRKFAEAAEATCKGILYEGEVPVDCPTFELSGGRWVETRSADGEPAEEDEDTARERELERQYMHSLRHLQGSDRRGLGAA